MPQIPHAATAEISRMQVWQWLHHNATLEDGRTLTTELYAQLLDEEMDAIREEIGAARFDGGHFDRAKTLFDEMIRSDEPVEFLTIPAYDEID